ncbi:tetratricopeptide repeat protein [Paraburkholderia aspalathi]|uniref:tetratricopeptide repeat protein n=1 Tax=Paraburkholderia aspalathi TaxID=1324617 RepID=UPI0038B72215
MNAFLTAALLAQGLLFTGVAAADPQVNQACSTDARLAAADCLKIEQYSKAISLAPNDARLYVERGEVRFRVGDNEQAVDDFTKAIQLKPTDYTVYWKRGQTFEELGRLSAAIADYTVVVNARPDAIRPILFRADDLVDMGRDDEAAKDYAVANRINPDEPHLLYGRLRFLYYQQNYHRSLDDADHWLSIAHQGKFSPSGESEYYVVIWRHMAFSQLGIDDRGDLLNAAKHLDRKNWPYPIIALYLGEISESELFTTIKTGDKKNLRNQLCEAYAYAGEAHLNRKDADGGRRLFVSAVSECPVAFVERVLADREIKRLAQVQ